MKKVGNKTDLMTQFGRPVYVTPWGELVSEKSNTMRVDDKWFNIPSIHGGYQYEEPELYKMLMDGKIRPTSFHETHIDAINAAKKRSKGLMRLPIGYGPLSMLGG